MSPKQVVPLALIGSGVVLYLAGFAASGFVRYFIQGAGLVDAIVGGVMLFRANNP